MVKRPATVPYSSISIAMCVFACCISLSSTSSGFESGMNSGSRMNAVIGVLGSSGAPRSLNMSFRYATPTISSTLSPITGTRE